MLDRGAGSAGLVRSSLSQRDNARMNDPKTPKLEISGSRLFSPWLAGQKATPECATMSS